MQRTRFDAFRFGHLRHQPGFNAPAHRARGLLFSTPIELQPCFDATGAFAITNGLSNISLHRVMEAVAPLKRGEYYHIKRREDFERCCKAWTVADEIVVPIRVLPTTLRPLQACRCATIHSQA